LVCQDFLRTFLLPSSTFYPQHGRIIHKKLTNNIDPVGKQRKYVLKNKDVNVAKLKVSFVSQDQCQANMRLASLKFCGSARTASKSKSKQRVQRRYLNSLVHTCARGPIYPPPPSTFFTQINRAPTPRAKQAKASKASKFAQKFVQALLRLADHLISVIV
jgi:hypothetical protein